MSNALLKIDHKVVQEWENSVLTPIHMVALMTNHTVVKGCSNAVCMQTQTPQQ